MSEDYYVEISEEGRAEDVNLQLPSEISAKKKEIRTKRAKSLKKYKWPVIVFFGIIAYLFYEPFVFWVLSLLKSNPTTYSYYLMVESNILNKTLLGLLFVSTLGSLFFLVLPSEAVFLYYLSSTDYWFVWIIGFSVLGSLVAFLFNYLFGFVLGERVVRFLFRKNFWNYKEKIEKWGGIVLFFGAIFPGPLEVLSIFYGVFKFSLKRYLFLIAFGRFIKYVILFVAYYFFWDSIMYWWNLIF